MNDKEGQSEWLIMGCLVTLCFSGAMLNGCTTPSTAVIAATGTTIGLEISQNQTTQTPTGVLGYKRAEFAYVPTNRGAATHKVTETGGKVTESQGLTTHGNGARDSANVLMELRYKGIWDWSADSGIYQRLAVGDEAVKQTGAALMFSKDSAGKLDAETAKYAAQAKANLSKETIRADKIISYVTDGSDAINAGTLATLLGNAKTKHPAVFTSTVETSIKSAGTGKRLKQLLLDDLDRTVNPLYDELPQGKQ